MRLGGDYPSGGLVREGVGGCECWYGAGSVCRRVGFERGGLVLRLASRYQLLKVEVESRPPTRFLIGKGRDRQRRWLWGDGEGKNGREPSVGGIGGL